MPLGLLVAYEGMCWRPAPEPAPPVPAPPGPVPEPPPPEHPQVPAPNQANICAFVK